MGYAQELKAFVDCAAGKAQPSVSLSEMFATMSVIFAIERSLASGQTVSPLAMRVSTP
jgi:predicted dehydrogenase